MRFTQQLCRQHIGFMAKRHWLVQGKRTPIDTGAAAELSARGVPVISATDFIKPNFPIENINIVGYLDKPVKLDDTHPLWKNRQCHMFADSNVLLEGIQQSQVLTKTILINNLPKNIEEFLNKIKISDNVENFMQQSVLNALVLDAQQEKTAIVKVPEKPMYVLPRNYGITDTRKNRLITSKLLLQCEKLSGHTITSNRKIIDNAYFILPYVKDNDNIQMQIHADKFIVSKKMIKPYDIERSVTESELPNLFPLKQTISMPTQNIYKLENVYPISTESRFSNPHTIVIHFSPLDVKNLFEEKVTENQFNGRSLLKAFTVAASFAKAKYGNDIKELPKPVTVQSIQTDGKKFYFGIFQLNTLNLETNDENNADKNVWYSIPSVNLYDECLYKSGKPVLSNYNNNVLKLMMAFYNNE